MKSIIIFSLGFFFSDKQNLCLKAALKFNHNLGDLAIDNFWTAVFRFV